MVAFLSCRAESLGKAFSSLCHEMLPRTLDLIQSQSSCFAERRSLRARRGQGCLAVGGKTEAPSSTYTQLLGVQHSLRLACFACLTPPPHTAATGASKGPITGLWAPGFPLRAEVGVSRRIHGHFPVTCRTQPGQDQAQCGNQDRSKSSQDQECKQILLITLPLTLNILQLFLL